MGKITQVTRNDYMRAWRARQSPEWHEANKIYLRGWHARNRIEQNKIRTARYKADPKSHSETVKACNKRRLETDPIGERARRKHKRKTIKAIRRRKIKLTDDRLTLPEWKALIEAWDGKCAYCKKLTPNPTQDHVIPLSKGGQHTMDNVVPACMGCNVRKSNLDLADFLMKALPK